MTTTSMNRLYLVLNYTLKTIHKKDNILLLLGCYYNPKDFDLCEKKIWFVIYIFC